MKITTCILISAVLPVCGCGRDSPPAAMEDQPAQRVVDEASRTSNSQRKEEPQAVVWNPSFIGGSLMLGDVRQFGAHVRGAQIVATGVLSEWDETRGKGFGKVRVDAVLHGKLNSESVPVIATGGVIQPKVGDKVFLLLAPRDGKLKLYSFCDSPGMYKYSDELMLVIKNSLQSKG